MRWFFKLKFTVLTSKVLLLFFLCLQANFENLMGGGILGELANDFISSEMPTLVQDNKGPILDDLTPLLKDLINDIVGDVTLDQLLDLINNTPKKA